MGILIRLRFLPPHPSPHNFRQIGVVNNHWEATAVHIKNREVHP